MPLSETTLTGSDLLLTGGRIFADADGQRHDEAMLVMNGRVEALGSASHIAERLRALGGGAVPELDLCGRTVLPGFIDAHTHVEFSTLGRNEWLDVRGLTPEQVCERIAARLEEPTPADAWIVAQGTFLQPLPGRAELDRLSPDTPVIVRESMHRLQSNSAALRRAGLLERAPALPAGIVVHVDDDRRPTGLIEEGFHLFPTPAPPPERLRELLERELRESFARHGVTTVFEIPASRAGVEAYADLARRGELPTRITLTPVVSPGLSPLLERMQDWRAADFGGAEASDLIDAGGLKIFVDGDNEQSFDTDTFERSPREWGAVTRTLGQLREELIWATEHDVQVWVHAIGDLAQEMALEAVAQAADRVGRPRLPMRIEHIANLKLSPGILARLGELGVVPVPTANFMHTDDGSGLYAYRTLAEAGLRPPGNSDTGGAIAQAPSPWFGIAHMVDRRNGRGEPVAPEEGVPAEEGLRGYTRYAAEVAGLDRLLGRLHPGFAADFAVYDGDPRTLPPPLMAEVEARMTFIGGRMTWRRGQ